MPDYRICLINPPGYKHSSCFLELAILLKSSFTGLGFKCDITVNQPDIDKINIILGGHLIENVSALKEFRYIPYQLEQLGAAQGIYTPGFEEYLRNSISIWDYSHENISFLNSRGLSARYVPVGYHRNLEGIPQNEKKVYDVLFYGSSCTRRSAILDRLTREGVKVKTLFGVYGQERDKEIAKSRMIINIHHYDTKIFETVRISYLLNNRCFVVCEESSLNPYGKVDLCLVAYDNLVKTCLDYLEKDQEREKTALRCYRQFKENYDMGGIIGRNTGDRSSINSGTG